MSRQPGLERAIRDLRKARDELKRLEARAPTIVGVEGIKAIHENFEKQSYNGSKWPARKAATNRAYDRRYGVKGSVFSSQNPLLRQSGNLFDAIRKKVQGAKVFLGFDDRKVPYGAVHNEGGTINKKARKTTVYFGPGKKFATQKVGTSKVGTSKKVTIGAHAIKMPQRQFMPKPSDSESKPLMERVVRKILFERDRILAKFARK